VNPKISTTLKTASGIHEFEMPMKQNDFDAALTAAGILTGATGERNDILAKLKAFENQHQIMGNDTLPQVGEKLHSDRKVGEIYSLLKNTVARYLRVHQLNVAYNSDIVPLLSGQSLIAPTRTLALPKFSDKKYAVAPKSRNTLSCS